MFSLRQYCLSLPDVVEMPHFEKTSFRVKKKIFVTLDEQSCLACFKFDAIQQSVFCTINHAAIYPVPNKWGLQGWTYVNSVELDESVLTDMINTAYTNVCATKQRKKV